MAENFGFKLGLEGEKEFKKALSDINQCFKVLGSEIKLVERQFGKNKNSIESLTARNMVLNKEIEAQKAKVDTLRSALENAATSFGENDKRTQARQIQLNNAEASLNNMEREVEDNLCLNSESETKHSRNLMTSSGWQPSIQSQPTRTDDWFSNFRTEQR